jgi:hypothetical protein
MTQEADLIVQIEEAIANLKEIRAHIIKQGETND